MLNTDFVVLIHDDDCGKALKVIEDGTGVLTKMGVPEEQARALRGQFGISGMCNIIGAIKMAKYLRLGPVAVATDGVDRHRSVLSDLESRCLEIEDFVLERWARDIFLEADERKIYDFRRAKAKEALFAQKERDWLPFGYKKEYLDAMKRPEFWEEEYQKVAQYDGKIRRMR
ncbi:MAG: hypothetical protein AB1497_07505 [Bacillota bacterium]